MCSTWPASTRRPSVAVAPPGRHCWRRSPRSSRTRTGSSAARDSRRTPTMASGCGRTWQTRPDAGLEETSALGWSIGSRCARTGAAPGAAAVERPTSSRHGRRRSATSASYSRCTPSAGSSCARSAVLPASAATGCCEPAG